MLSCIYCYNFEINIFKKQVKGINNTTILYYYIMRLKKNVFCCRFCKKSFSSSQRLESHLTKKKPCHPTLLIEDTDNKNIVIVSDDTTKEEIPSNPFQGLIEFIDDFELPELKQDNLDILTCEYCNKVFKNKYNLGYHLSVCEKKHILQSQQFSNIASFKKQCSVLIHAMSKLLDEKDATIRDLQKQIQEDNKNKTKIIEQQNIIQEKAIDALTYLQQNHQNTPAFEFPPRFQLTDEDIKRYINMNNTNALIDILRKMFLDGRPLQEVPLWCLDTSREKFAIKDNKDWQIEYGGNKLIKHALDPVHDQFLRYLGKISKDYLGTDKLCELIDIQQKVINMREDKTKKQVIKEACNEFNVKKVFQES